MAYAALVSLHHTSNSILNHDKYSISVGEREKITSIHEYVIYLISFLDDLPEKANRLEGKIRSLANEAEDLIEHIMRVNFRKNWGSFELSRVEVEHQLKRVREEIGSITGDVMDYRPAAAVSSSRVAGMPTPKIDVVIGLDDDLLEIRSRLCGLSSKLQVIPIVGMGGIGKTTLAQKAYDEQLIIEYFDVRVWVTVSPDYSVDEILSNFRLILSMELFEKNESMAEKVYKSLKGRRYLIVMDDVWSTDSWDDMRYIFPDDSNGSRIMLTTRLSDVAAYTSCGSPVHEMKFMDGSQSWNLLRQKVFREGQDCPLELENMGKAIAKSCRGLPLAVVLVAGILSTIDESQASWEKIKKNLNKVVDEHLEKILYLSYGLLPHHLRPCFLFMAGFPEDHTIRVSRLIKLWVAEGFLRCENGYKSLEEEAEEYVEDLVKRNLLLITTRKSNEKIKSCRLHDLVRDMCIRKAHEEKFLATGRYLLPTVRKDERRISVGHSCLDEIHSPTINTILCFKPSFRDHWSLDFVVNFRLLRVLDVINKYTRVVPPQVFELFHLRYLSLRSVIPATISNLENLQTLIIQASIGRESQPFVSCLPMEIWRMQQLRHLVLSGYHGLPYPCTWITSSTELANSCGCTKSFMWPKDPQNDSKYKKIRNHLSW